jgi:hypothetical protein
MIQPGFDETELRQRPRVTLVPAWFGRELAPNADGGVNGRCTGEDPELRLVLKNGDGAKKGDGEKRDEAGDVVGDGAGAEGEGSCSACSPYGDSVVDGGAADDVSRFRKGGRPSWSPRSSTCASQWNWRGSDMSPVVLCPTPVPPGGTIALGDALGRLEPHLQPAVEREEHGMYVLVDLLFPIRGGLAPDFSSEQRLNSSPASPCAGLRVEVRDAAREDLAGDHAITLHAAVVKLPAFALFVTRGVSRRCTPASRPPNTRWFKLSPQRAVDVDPRGES